jgi:hypothetical protein
MATAGKRILWAGRTISGLVSLVFLMSAVLKVMGGAEVMQGMVRTVGAA